MPTYLERVMAMLWEVDPLMVECLTAIVEDGIDLSEATGDDSFYWNAIRRTGTQAIRRVLCR